jgi:hypothetical protein
MTACGSSIPPSPARPPLPANLTALCPDLTPLEGKTGAHLERKLAEIGPMYRDCAARHAELVDAMK